MEINSTRFGTQEISDESVIDFPNGLVGFESLKQFKLFHDSENENPNVHWLQSVDDADLSFSVANPETFNITYEFTLTDEELAALQLEDMQNLVVLLLVYRNDGTAGELIPSADKLQPQVRASLAGPILINTNKCVGMQKLLSSISYSTLVRELV